MVDTQFRVGDKIIDFDQVFKIFKIQKEKINGENRRVMYFKPYFNANEDRNIICSIPIRSAINSDIRKPIDKTTLRELYASLPKKIRIKDYPDLNDSKILLNSNDPKVIVRLLKELWREKVDKKEGFSSAKKKIFEKALMKLTQEFAYVGKTTPNKAKVKIELALKK